MSGQVAFNPSSMSGLELSSALDDILSEFKAAFEKAQASDAKLGSGGDYLIQKGDTLTDIARRFGTTVDALVEANGIEDPDYIRAGDTLRIPGSVEQDASVAPSQSRSPPSAVQAEQPVDASEQDQARNDRDTASPVVEDDGATPEFKYNSGIDLTGIVGRTNALTDFIEDQTGYEPTVTSGYRPPERQAAAMYNNYEQGGAPQYADQASEQEVRNAYEQGKAAGKSPETIKSDMAAVLQAQTERGVYLSDHMTGDAVDLALPGGGRTDEVVEAIRESGLVDTVLVEDDHIHIELKEA